MRRLGIKACCPLCASESIQALVMPKQAIGAAFVTEFVLGTSAGVAAGATHQLAHVCLACGSGWQPGTDSEARLREMSERTMASTEFSPDNHAKPCHECLAEIPLSATRCRCCAAEQKGEDTERYVLAIRAELDEIRRRLTPQPDNSPVVSQCFVCHAPLKEVQVHRFKGRSYCEDHFGKAIG